MQCGTKGNQKLQNVCCLVLRRLKRIQGMEIRITVHPEVQRADTGKVVGSGLLMEQEL